MNKDQMSEYGYELMVKNNPDEAVKNLVLKDKRIYKALCIIDEKRGEYDIPSDLEDVLRGRDDE